MKGYRGEHCDCILQWFQVNMIEVTLYVSTMVPGKRDCSNLVCFYNGSNGMYVCLIRWNFEHYVVSLYLPLLFIPDQFLP